MCPPKPSTYEKDKDDEEDEKIENPQEKTPLENEDENPEKQPGAGDSKEPDETSGNSSPKKSTQRGKGLVSVAINFDVSTIFIFLGPHKAHRVSKILLMAHRFEQ